MISFTAPGKPIPQPRPKGGARGNHYVPADHPVHAWRQLVSFQAKRAWPYPPVRGPVRVKITFCLPRPKKGAEPGELHTRKPDLDNLAKAVLDAIEGIVFANDSQVAELSLRKVWADGSPEARVRVEPGSAVQLYLRGAERRDIPGGVPGRSRRPGYGKYPALGIEP